MNIGEYIKHVRKRMRLNQAEFAEKLDMRPATLAKYECGIRNPNFEQLAKMVKNGISFDDFILKYAEDASQEGDKFSESDINDMIQKFRELDDYGREALILLCNHEHTRCMETIK